MAADDISRERRLLAVARRAEIAETLRADGSVRVSDLEERYGVSSMTARRDLHQLEREGLARRTHGGAMLPSVAGHEDSFSARVETDVEAKAALGAAAADRVGEGETVFLDGSSTATFVARALLERRLPVTIITNSLPVMELVAAHAGGSAELIGVGGQLRPLSRSFVGPDAIHTVLGHFADRVFLSVKGVTSTGAITDADALEAEVKRAMIAHAEDAVLLLDASKLQARGLSVIATIADLRAVLVHGADPGDAPALLAPGVELTRVG